MRELTGVDGIALQIEAEALPDISESFEVDAVPYFILLRVSLKSAGRPLPRDAC